MPHSSNKLDSLRKLIESACRACENETLTTLIDAAQMPAAARARVWGRAKVLVETIRARQEGRGGIDALLNEFSLSTEEGVVLMCLAEALLRVPDAVTADRLIRDKLTSGDWGAHLGNSDSLFVNASAWGLIITGKMMSFRSEQNEQQMGLLKTTVGRIGEPVVRAAVRQAMKIMGAQFVLGKTIDAALDRAQEQERAGFRYSYDMLGEGARTAEDAERYYQSYLNAIETIGRAAKGRGPISSPGISVKLSAIHPRYEYSHRARVLTELVPKVCSLAQAAKSWDIGFTVDAEEADRLDLSLDVIEAVFRNPQLRGWDGFGLAVQAYQPRALFVIGWVDALARSVGQKIMVRLVKGAYWDAEIKHSQLEGFDGYPVFTRKYSTDVSYQACARKLLSCRDQLFPQFATHNAYTVATILELDREFGEWQGSGFEFQRLHGMGESLYQQVMENSGISCRVYAPVGQHEDLLAYLVRRLLENGANSSFVNNIVDPTISVESLLQDPVETVRQWADRRNPAIPMPRDLYLKVKGHSAGRTNSSGMDLTHAPTVERLSQSLECWTQTAVAEHRSATEQAVRNPANLQECIGAHQRTSPEDIDRILQNAEVAKQSWPRSSAEERAALLRRLADSMEHHADELIAICVKEAGKTFADGVAEVREAVDFCRFYGDQAERIAADHSLSPRGLVLCISPWNFPLAIFLGQVSAALAAGNVVLAKPSEQTTLIAVRALELLSEVGLPDHVVQLIFARGSVVGERVVPDPRINAVMFTGSTETGQRINQALAQRDDDVPLIAETGGQNCMIVDSTALPEQVVDDVIRSGFQSAGQRCSALRVLFVQEDIAPQIITMIEGAMQELTIGDPAHLDTDVGPVIDEKALAALNDHKKFMETHGQLLFACEENVHFSKGHFFAPHLYEIDRLSVLPREVFGPVVHVIRYRAKQLDQVVDQINLAGYGLTLGVHSRISTVCERIARRAKVGNVYVNRNMIGAVVGVQPFGGRGLSGTGPKAGGPDYLRQLMAAPKEREQVIGGSGLTLDLQGQPFTPAGEAHHPWADLKKEDRLGVLQLALSSLAEEHSLFSEQALESALAQLERGLSWADTSLWENMPLPGPTGESNTLRHESRGLVALHMEGQEGFNDWLQALYVNLLCGNTLCVTLSEDEGCRDCQQICLDGLFNSGLPKSACRAVPLAQFNDLLATPALSLVQLVGKRCNVTSIRERLAARPGPILSVLSAPLSPHTLFNLVCEKTVSIDTTAAGGNASLMTLAES